MASTTKRNVTSIVIEMKTPIDLLRSSPDDVQGLLIQMSVFGINGNLAKSVNDNVQP